MNGLLEQDWVGNSGHFAFESYGWSGSIGSVVLTAAELVRAGNTVLTPGECRKGDFPHGEKKVDV